MYFSRCARRREARRAEASSSAKGEPERGDLDDDARAAEAPPLTKRWFSFSFSFSFSFAPKRLYASLAFRGSSVPGPFGNPPPSEELASSLDPRRASRRSASARLERALRGAESSSSPQPERA
jgi:hypothetical protein